MTFQGSRASTAVDFLRQQQRTAEEQAASTAKRQRQLIAAGLESRTRYGRALFRLWGQPYLESLEELVQRFVLSNGQQAGPHYCAIPLLLHFSSRGLEPVVATALRVVLDRISRKRRYKELASAIGRAVEDESRAVAIHRRAEAPARMIAKREGKRGLIAPKTLEAYALRGDRWERRDRFELGALLLDALLSSTQLLAECPGQEGWLARQLPGTTRFEAPSDPAPVAHGLGISGRVRRRDGASLDYLQNISLPLQAKSLSEADSTQLRLDPWMVQAVAKAWDKGLDLFPAPPPVAYDSQPVMLRDRWIAERERRQRAKDQLRVDATIRRMMEAGADPFRLEHFFDFRGRLYCPGPITYQGPDFVKACLEFAQVEEELDLPEAFRAAAGHWGHGMQRTTWADRLEWGQYHLVPMTAAAADPFAHRWWMEAESPWQLLQVCRAVAVKRETGHSAGLPIRFDQTCSGVGHVAALLQHRELAELTNMTGQWRLDVYEVIADMVASQLRADLETCPARSRLAGFWLEIGIDRALMKKPVMSSVYGARHYSIRDGFAETLLSRVTLKHPADYDLLVARPAAYLAKVTMAVMKERIGPVFELQKWMGEVVRIVTKAGKEVEWTSPSGFPVRLHSHRSGIKPVRTHLGGSSGWRTEDSADRAEELSSAASGPGATANLIHSFEAAVVHQVRAEAGQLLTTHDCFAVPCGAESVAKLKLDLRLAIPSGAYGRLGTTEWGLRRIWLDIALNSGLDPARLPLPPFCGGPDGARLNLGSNPYLFS